MFYIVGDWLIFLSSWLNWQVSYQESISLINGQYITSDYYKLSVDVDQNV